ncbi:MAG: hypothetical protein ACM34I_08870 [bacterium]
MEKSRFKPLLIGIVIGLLAGLWLGINIGRDKPLFSNPLSTQKIEKAIVRSGEKAIDETGKAIEETGKAIRETAK